MASLTYSMSMKDTEAFKMLVGYTKALVEILEEYPLSEEDRLKLDGISKEFFKLKMEAEL